MKRANALSVVAALGISAAFCSPASALPPPPAAPLTLWNFLGIPQGLNKIRDVTTNRRGNFPGMERKPPLKALADPSNLNSPVSAIKKAAEIKTEEDMAPQKIKAIKYLATIGCGCYGGVKEALMESLEDCTEEVRYQTVLAIEDAASMHCEVCNRDCCCDEEMTKKLAEIAYEKNDKGCWLEPSERVREAAKRAMCACCPGQGPAAEPSEPAPSSEETIPQPPTAAEPEPTARRVPAGEPNVVSAKRVREGRGKAMLPHSDAGDTVVTEEVVTIDFGNQGGSASSKVTTSARRTTAPTSPATIRKTTPAPVKQQAPVKESAAVQQPASAADAVAAEPLARVKQPSSHAATSMGPSSRRAAVERGLAAPAVLPIETKTPPAIVRSAEVKVKRPANPIQQLLRPIDTDATARAGDQNVGSTMAFVEGDANGSGTVSLAPKSGPPALRPRVITKPQQPVRGTVARVSADTGTVELRIPGSENLLAVGDRLKLSHEFLLDDGFVVGYLEVVSTGPRGVTAKPIGNLKIDNVKRGDSAVLEPFGSSASTRKSVATR